jgi:PD-(D/E)XK endonuclease
MRVVVRGNVGVEIGVLCASADGLLGKASDKSVRPTQPKRLGEIAEAAFLAKASRLKFGVACPWGDSDRYDFIVDSGGRLWKVQVKSAHRAGEDGGYSFRLHGSSMAAYGADEIDLLVAYIVSEDVWYVFPVRELGGLRSVKLYPGSRKKRSRFEKYREGWWVMTGAKAH